MFVLFDVRVAIPNGKIFFFFFFFPQMAMYFCASVLKNEQFFTHYALNVPLYTHFTSPIRRYADIIVHRLLASSLST